MDAAPTSHSLPPALLEPAPVFRTLPDETPGLPPRRRPGQEWYFLQLLPSPGFKIGASSASFRWQLTPLLYSWGVHPRISPWRFGITEPLTRVSGSIEFPLQIGYAPTPISTQWHWSVGARAYFPVAEYGEGWSLSLGAFRSQKANQSGWTTEAGAWFLFGFFGFTAAYTPNLPSEEWAFHFRIRYL